MTERFTDVNKYIEQHLSVTEMEMQFGVLQRKEDMHAYFYIKENEIKQDVDNSYRFGVMTAFNDYVTTLEASTPVQSNLDLFYRD